MNGLTWHIVTIDAASDYTDVANCRCGWTSGERRISEAAMETAIATHLRATGEYIGWSEVFITHHRKDDVTVALTG